ncbi:hypothetical protein [Bdellovibrio sp. NC01]|uniref:hypothetical protein n=1 Tax=Bdellovibrio sp. NC01 TaxID=2220073 RepID=UPI00115AEAD1|nr:hypothetical protein [Bdellovibrio sp. NC01]QDK37941.1 hypothetical protein DOE51_10260 [Bdellovibrio sp. NC01]
MNFIGSDFTRFDLKKIFIQTFVRNMSLFCIILAISFYWFYLNSFTLTEILAEERKLFLISLLVSLAISVFWFLYAKRSVSISNGTVVFNGNKTLKFREPIVVIRHHWPAWINLHLNGNKYLKICVEEKSSLYFYSIEIVRFSLASESEQFALKVASAVGGKAYRLNNLGRKIEIKSEGSVL